MNGTARFVAKAPNNRFMKWNHFGFQTFGIVWFFCFVAMRQILTTLTFKEATWIHASRTEFMDYNRPHTIFLALALTGAAAGVAGPAAAAELLYDGVWDVTIVTKSGSCEPAAHSTLTITDGRISGPGADITGSIGHAGLVRVTIRGAYANGQLSGNTGSGKWNGASSGVPCSGRWEASRQQNAAIR